MKNTKTNHSVAIEGKMEKRILEHFQQHQNIMLQLKLNLAYSS